MSLRSRFGCCAHIIGLAGALLAVAGPAATDETAAADDETAVGEPTEDEIREAFRRRVQAVSEGAAAVVGTDNAGAFALELEELVKLQCDRIDSPNPEYDCRVEIRLRQGDGRPRTAAAHLWLRHDGEDWVAR